MKKTRLASCLIAISSLSAYQLAKADDAHHADQPSIAPAEAIAKLKEGNARYVSESLQHPDESKDRRTELAKSQHPFAVIVGCSDSRVPSEIVFDQGLGDLFVIRLAGHVISDEALGSIEYAIEHLNTRLVVVLGHQRCGAVQAARQALATKSSAPG